MEIQDARGCHASGLTPETSGKERRAGQATASRRELGFRGVRAL